MEKIEIVIRLILSPLNVIISFFEGDSALGWDLFSDRQELCVDQFAGPRRRIWNSSSGVATRGDRRSSFGSPWTSFTCAFGLGSPLFSSI